MYENIDTYKTRKLIYQIIFNFYENDYTDDISVFNLIIIESLRNIVEYLAKNNYLSNDVINNVNNFLLQARDYKDEYREERINVINDIIRIMNNEEKDESLIFYRIELLKRRKDFRYITKYSDYQITKEIENVHDSICNDLYVLISHTDDTSDIEFINEFLPYLKDSAIYYESLNAFLKENPTVFKDRTFYNRMMCILNLNNEIYKENKDMIDLNKKLVKKIDKKVKKV